MTAITGAQWWDIIDAGVAAEAPLRMGLWWKFRDQQEVLFSRALWKSETTQNNTTPDALLELLRVPVWIPTYARYLRVWLQTSTNDLSKSTSSFEVRITNGVQTVTGNELDDPAESTSLHTWEYTGINYPTDRLSLSTLTKPGIFDVVLYGRPNDLGAGPPRGVRGGLRFMVYDEANP